MMWLGEKPIPYVKAWNVLCDAVWERLDFYGLNRDNYHFDKLPPVPCKYKKYDAVSYRHHEMRTAIVALIRHSFDPAQFGEWVLMPNFLERRNGYNYREVEDPTSSFYIAAEIDGRAFLNEPLSVPSRRHTASEFIKAAAKLVNDKIVYPGPGQGRRIDSGFTVNCDMEYIQYHGDGTVTHLAKNWGDNGGKDIVHGYGKTELVRCNKEYVHELVGYIEAVRYRSFNHRWTYFSGKHDSQTCIFPELTGIGKLRYPVSASVYKSNGGTTDVLPNEIREVDIDFNTGCAVEIIDFSKISNEIKDMWDNGYKTWENGSVSADLGEIEAQILLNKENFPEINYKYME